MSSEPASTDAPSASGGILSGPLVLGVAATLLLAAFAYSLGNDFVWDDRRQIVENHLIQHDRFFLAALRSDVWAFRAEGGSSNYYRPAAVLWMIVNHRLFGLHPFGWHLANLLAHAVVTALVFLVVRELKASPVVTALTTWLFAVHPVHVETVVWPSASVDVQVACGVLSAYWLYLRQRGRGRWGSTAMAAALYATAMFAKETAVVFPALVGLTEWFLLGREGRGGGARLRSALRSMLPYAGVVAAYLVVRFAIARVGYQAPPQQMSWREWAVFAPQALAFYARQSLLPVFVQPMNSLRPMPGAWAAWLWLSPVVAAAVAIFLLRAWRRSLPHCFACGVFVLFIALPIVGARGFPPDERVHDRYLYLPVLGAVLLAVLAAERAWARQPRVLVGSGLSLAVVFAIGSAAYAARWRNEPTLWAYAADRCSTCVEAHVRLSDAQRRAGRLADARRTIDAALRVDPARIGAVLADGMILAEERRWTEAEERFRRVIEFDRSFMTAFDQLGRVYFEQGRFGDAIATFEEARRAFPAAELKYAGNIAVAAWTAGFPERVLSELGPLRERLDASPDPGDRRFHLLYAEACVALGRRAEAESALRHFMRTTAGSGDSALVADQRRAAAMLEALAHP